MQFFGRPLAGQSHSIKLSCKPVSTATYYGGEQQLHAMCMAVVGDSDLGDYDGLRKLIPRRTKLTFGLNFPI